MAERVMWAEKVEEKARARPAPVPWSEKVGKEALTLRGHTAAVLSLALSADGKRLCSGSGGIDKPSEIKVWDLEAGQ